MKSLVGRPTGAFLAAFVLFTFFGVRGRMGLSSPPLVAASSLRSQMCISEALANQPPRHFLHLFNRVQWALVVTTGKLVDVPTKMLVAHLMKSSHIAPLLCAAPPRTRATIGSTRRQGEVQDPRNESETGPIWRRNKAGSEPEKRPAWAPGKPAEPGCTAAPPAPHFAPVRAAQGRREIS